MLGLKVIGLPVLKESDWENSTFTVVDAKSSLS